ncbi:hypothetical protein FB45DRAFT_1017867 [Roridomyces roridus]|uniref:Uncharacterized protein n=1 Tax=Roridomyces roridus TaxID=1738132 RepID=A0AAD7CJE7_9AGAR|nr:hypothetical protein FB45DRAFT_1017867 [Roridomyces roridus]
MPSLGSPLPPEPEKEIFELAAYCFPGMIPAMLLTAWRVKICRRASTRKNAYLPDDSNLSRISSTTSGVLRHSVRHLYIDHLPNRVEELHLSLCENVHDLWLYLADYTSVLDLLGSLPLRRLYCCVEDPLHSVTPDFTHPIFAQLTHLEIFPGTTPSVSAWAGLALIPNLTHLAFSDHDFVELVPNLLQSFKFLRVVILLADPSRIAMSCNNYTRDWHMGALVGLDYWARAEEFIAQRRSRAVERKLVHCEFLFLYDQLIVVS